MEFVRIDPFVRQTMINNKGTLTATFKIPDVYGVYQFKINLSMLSTPWWKKKKKTRRI